MIPLPFSTKQKLDAVKRELGFRNTVYRRRVADGKMAKADMDREISIFEAIQRDYEQVAANERNASDLFGSETAIEHDPFVRLGDAAMQVVSSTRRKLEAEATRFNALASEVGGAVERLREIEASHRNPQHKDAAE